MAKCRGTNEQEYQIYLACADDGKGGDITNNNKPLKTYGEWLGPSVDLGADTLQDERRLDI